MDDVIFSGFGVEVIERNGRFFVRYDAGEIATQIREDEISKEEAAKVQRSEEDAYEVLLACQQRSSH
jgi:hypothetical protein